MTEAMWEALSWIGIVAYLSYMAATVWNIRAGTPLAAAVKATRHVRAAFAVACAMALCDGLATLLWPRDGWDWVSTLGWIFTLLLCGQLVRQVDDVRDSRVDQLIEEESEFEH